jgi:hypothetical protein
MSEEQSTRLLSDEQFMTLLQAIADAQVGIDTIDAISVGSPHRLLSGAGGWSSGPLW